MYVHSLCDTGRGIFFFFLDDKDDIWIEIELFVRREILIE